MLVNTAESLMKRTEINILESYYFGGVKIYKLLLVINRYDKSVYSPIVVDNIIMTISYNEQQNKIYYNVLDATSRRSYSMFATYKECLGEHEFVKYIRALNRKVNVMAASLGILGHRAHIIRREAWHNSTLSACLTIE